MSALSDLLAAKPSAPITSTPTAPPAAPVAAVASPNPSNVPTPQGGSPDTLALLLSQFNANAGKMPQVNPPEAAKVIAGPVASEVAGNPEPAEAPEVVPSPVAKSAEQLAAEAAPRTRRTAAVVQVELDAALAELAALKAAPLRADVATQTDHIALLESDLTKCHARNAELQAYIEKIEAAVKAHIDGPATVAPVLATTADFLLGGLELIERAGFTATLTRAVKS